MKRKILLLFVTMMVTVFCARAQVVLNDINDLLGDYTFYYGESGSTRMDCQLVKTSSGYGLKFTGTPEGTIPVTISLDNSTIKIENTQFVGDWKTASVTTDQAIVLLMYTNGSSVYRTASTTSVGLEGTLSIDPETNNVVWTMTGTAPSGYSFYALRVANTSEGTYATITNTNISAWNNPVKLVKEKKVVVTVLNEENFPDANFRAVLASKLGINEGDEITANMIASTTSLGVSHFLIADLTGIEFFTALTYLNCGSNQLTALDVSKNTALKELYCFENQLTALDVSNNTALKLLHCYDNQLTALDVSKNIALTELYCSNNQLTALDVSKNTALTELGCGTNQLTTLDVSKNTALRKLYCGTNQLTALDVSKNTALTELSCFRNQLTALDVSNNTALTKLYCEYNQLTALDVSKNIALTRLYCNNNQLTALDVSNNTALVFLQCYCNRIKGAAMDALVTSLPTVTSGEFYVIDTQDENEGNVCTKTQVNAAKAKGWTVYDNNGDNGVEYEGSDDGLFLNATYFPDANFRAALASTRGINEGDEITANMIASTPYLDVSDKSIADLTGIEYFTALTELNCSSNQLTALDVSGCTALTHLDCSSNQLTALNVSKNTVLTMLWCEYNQLTSLDVSKNTALTRLSCYNNQLTALDVSNNTALTNLDCSSNQLTALDVSNNTALTILGCGNNQLTSLDVSKNTALTGLGCYNNQLTALDVSNNTALTQLSCNSNQLTALDVSNNTVLTWLECYNNQLTALDVSNNTALTSLYCYNNQLTALDVPNNTALTQLVCYNNQLTALDVSNNTALGTLVCNYNQLTALDVSKNTALTQLSCNSNQLTALDVSNNTALTSLSCEYNQLTALDVSNNTALKFLLCFSNQIKGAAMDALVTSLPTVSSGHFFVIDTQNENEGNVCTKTQVNIAKAKGWSVWDYYVEYEGSDELILNEDNFTDTNFRAALSTLLGINEDDEITPEMIDAVTTLNVSNKTISDLSGIKNFTELETLYCQLNQIKDADMDNLIEELPTRTPASASPVGMKRARNTWGALYAYDNTAGNEGNVITTEQVADANAKGWKVYQYNGTAWEEYTGTSTGITNLSNDDDIIGTWYTLDGKRLNDKPQKAGIYIVKMSNGTMKKVAVK